MLELRRRKRLQTSIYNKSKSLLSRQLESKLYYFNSFVLYTYLE